MIPVGVLMNLSLAQATVSTLATVMIVGLGFLHRPSRASLLWSAAFALAMTSTWVSVIGVVVENEAIRRAGLGVMLGAPALIWSGFRARRGARALTWISPVQALLSAALFVVAADPVAYGIAFRVAFLAAAVLAGLTILEVRRVADPRERLALPLVVVSAGFVILGLGSTVAAIAVPDSAGDLELPRQLNGLAMLVYLVCATVSLLYFTSVSPGYALSTTSWPHFSVTASERLSRAKAAGETTWAVLAIRLDDSPLLRSAVGEESWARIVSEFETVVTTSFPADADIGREGKGRMFVVISRPASVIRENIRTALRRITEVDATAWIDVQVSASIGWVPAASEQYDLDALVAHAGVAASRAARQGGDRWERVRG